MKNEHGILTSGGLYFGAILGRGGELRRHFDFFMVRIRF